MTNATAMKKAQIAFLILCNRPCQREQKDYFDLHKQPRETCSLLLVIHTWETYSQLTSV